MFYLFEPRQRIIRDEKEMRDVLMRYGEQAKSVLRMRSDDANLTTRERKHWRRLARKMPRFQVQEALRNSGTINHSVL